MPISKEQCCKFTIFLVNFERFFANSPDKAGNLPADRSASAEFSLPNQGFLCQFLRSNVVNSQFSLSILKDFLQILQIRPVTSLLTGPHLQNSVCQIRVSGANFKRVLLPIHNFPCKFFKNY